MGGCSSTLLDGVLVYGLVTASFLVGMGLACWFAMMPSPCAHCEQILQALDLSETSNGEPLVDEDDAHRRVLTERELDFPPFDLCASSARHPSLPLRRYMDQRCDDEHVRGSRQSGGDV